MIERCCGKFFLQQTKPTLYGGEDSLGEKLVLTVQREVVCVKIHRLFHELVLAPAVACLVPLLDFLHRLRLQPKRETFFLIAHKTSIPAA